MIKHHDFLGVLITVIMHCYKHINIDYKHVFYVFNELQIGLQRQRCLIMQL